MQALMTPIEGILLEMANPTTGRTWTVPQTHSAMGSTV
jgi:hypothetical protein